METNMALAVTRAVGPHAFYAGGALPAGSGGVRVDEEEEEEEVELRHSMCPYSDPGGSIRAEPAAAGRNNIQVDDG